MIFSSYSPNRISHLNGIYPIVDNTRERHHLYQNSLLLLIALENNSIHKTQQNENEQLNLKIGQRPQQILPRKIYRCQMSAWKDVPRSCSVNKLRQLWGTTTHFSECAKFGILSTKRWRGGTATGNFILRQWKCRMPLWKTALWLFTNPGILLPYDPANAFFGIYLNKLETCVHIQKPERKCL